MWSIPCSRLYVILQCESGTVSQWQHYSNGQKSNGGIDYRWYIRCLVLFDFRTQVLMAVGITFVCTVALTVFAFRMCIVFSALIHFAGLWYYPLTRLPQCLVCVWGRVLTFLWWAETKIDFTMSSGILMCALMCLTMFGFLMIFFKSKVNTKNSLSQYFRQYEVRHCLTVLFLSGVPPSFLTF